MINLDRCIVVFQKNERQCLMVGIVCVWGTKSMSSVLRSFNVSDCIMHVISSSWKFLHINYKGPTQIQRSDSIQSLPSVF